MNIWSLPQSLRLGDRQVGIHADYRDILEILTYLNDPQYPQPLAWAIAIGLFYREPVETALWPQAAGALAAFISAGQNDRPGPVLMDWEQDAPAIISDVNAVAGREIRQAGFIHWWTFLAWFHGIGPGQLSTLVGIRDKLHRGKPLDGWEKEFYARNRDSVDLKKRLSPSQEAEKQRLENLLEGGTNEKQ